MRVLVNSYRLPSTWAKLERDSIKLSLTLMKNLSTFKVNESALESIREHESFRPNKSESLNSRQLSSSLGPGSRISLGTSSDS